MHSIDEMNPHGSARAQVLARPDLCAAHATNCADVLRARSNSSAQSWLELVQQLMLHHDVECAECALQLAMQEHPQSADLRQAHAGVLIHKGETDAAEKTLRALLQTPAAPVASRFVLARLLKDQGRMHAAAQVLRAAFDDPGGDLEERIQAIELLDDCGRKRDAAAICERAIGAGCRDARLHAYAGMLLAQLGQFDVARERYVFAAERSEQAPEWHVPLALSGLQRYPDGAHPDFALFRRYLGTALSNNARASLLFALGKAHDDIGECGNAAGYLRQANALVASQAHWSRKRWRRSIDMRCNRQLPQVNLARDYDWTPVFVVGVPRSGTTLVAQRLVRHPLVCHRGELPWLPALAERLEADTGNDRQRLGKAAAVYAAQLRQDDAEGARWFIDKQPRNFLNVDLILSLFPNARIIQCQRSVRDTALSLWMQSFHDHSLDFSCAFADIAAYIRGARRLMMHWQRRFPASVRTLNYEDLVIRPEACLGDLATWLGLPGGPAETLAGDDAISTASLWQARQPIHTRSVGRWKLYVPFMPELLQLLES